MSESVCEQKKHDWEDAKKSLPEENLYVVCRHDDYYFIGYVEDSIWHNHSAADSVITDVEYWKRFDL